MAHVLVVVIIIFFFFSSSFCYCFFIIIMIILLLLYCLLLLLLSSSSLSSSLLVFLLLLNHHHSSSSISISISNSNGRLIRSGLLTMMDFRLSIISYTVPHRNVRNRSKYNIHHQHNMCTCSKLIVVRMGWVVCHSDGWVGGVITNSNKESRFISLSQIN